LIENSVVRDRAWFDGAQFDAAFTLHASVFNGQSIFRNTRFAAPVEITSSQFEPAGACDQQREFRGRAFRRAGTLRPQQLQNRVCASTPHALTPMRHLSAWQRRSVQAGAT
jgi:hypothetical protein